MKIKPIHCALLLLAASLGCDTIDDPIIAMGNNYRADLYGEAPVFTSLPASAQIKRVVIEDFTGHHCGNCPPAHLIATSILEGSGEDKVSVMAVHCTGLAEPTDPPYLADYRSPEGDAYWQPFTGFGIPLGRINRSGGIDFPWTPPQWQAETTDQLSQDPLAVMQMVVDFQGGDNKINVHVNTEYLSAVSGSTRLVMVVLESHIISPQLWYDHDPETVPDYEHNHMLRGAFTGAFGLNNATNPVAGTIVNNSYTFDWNTNWVPENCSVLAFIVDGTTGEIINSVEKYLVE